MSGGNRNHGHGGDAVLKKILRSRRGEGYLDVCILVLCAMLVIALAVRVFPVFVAKQQLDTFATELNQEVTVTVTYETNIGLFSGFGSFPITLRADAAGKSEVYWK